jgi:chromosomal replication initiation ATPase DnaA
MTQLQLAEAQIVAGEECARAGVTMADVRGKRRRDRIVAIRRAIARRLRNETLLTYPEIGRVINRDHSTVLSLLGVHRVPVVRLTTCGVGALA